MGSVSQFHDRIRPPAHRIESEEEAVACARRFATAIRQQASEHDINRILPYAELDELSRSGLTAIGVPPDYDGLDVSNSLLAEIVAIIAEGDASIGECLEVHFQALEHLRTQTGDELKKTLFARVLEGDRFAATSFSEATALHSKGLGYQLNGRSVASSGILFADWIAISATDASGCKFTLHILRESEGLQIVDDWDGFGQRTNGSASVVATNAHINADAAELVSFVSHPTSAAIGALLHASVDLGIARASLSDLAGSPQAPATEIGKLTIGIETAAALLERAGRKLDIAQVNPTETMMDEAYFSASAARITASDVALEAANAVFAFSDCRTASIGLNLDRHWRNIRIRSIGAATDELYRNASGHYFKLRK
jgi:alkylation response protein AidB-like acyl-CoA dehydrogenase